MKHIKGLDSLRAFAIFFVILEHWSPEIPLNDFLYFIKVYIIPDGQSGVNTFFVLSGFLITSILLEAKKNLNGNNPINAIKNFAVRRSLRIFPIYYLLLFFLLAINFEGVRAHIGYYATYTSNILFYKHEFWGLIGNTWSLAVEEQFYLIWPWVILFVNNRYLIWVFFASIVISILSIYLRAALLNKGSFPILLDSCIGSFGIGGLYAFSRSVDYPEKKFQKILLPFFLVSLLIYIYWRCTHDIFWEKTAFLFRFLDSVIALQVIVFILNSRSAFLKKYVLENKVLNFIGKISYGLYLYHSVLKPVYDGYLGRFRLKHPDYPPIIYDYWVSYFTKIALLILIAWLSYVCIEKPFLNLKSRFRYNSH